VITRLFDFHALIYCAPKLTCSLERIVPTGPDTMEIRYQYLFVNPPEELGDAEKHAIDTSAEVRIFYSRQL
jgi:hypothetical protein